MNTVHLTISNNGNTVLDTFHLIMIEKLLKICTTYHKTFFELRNKGKQINHSHQDRYQLVFSAFHRHEIHLAWINISYYRQPLITSVTFITSSSVITEPIGRLNSSLRICSVMGKERSFHSL